ncbi:GNAT family N-acetyltransferase [Shewanella abyssi]|uniref:GNAT family N-acetyltransferase n=1 Tax=Shewanella abyssi TaxID=311789 RepID=UPI00200DE2EA|nr:GNAT family N-acetyltransferase [Shewanella abyssi]MCL1048185.1 GNAT family N-acetyltransferase [Shewanella abyssi]
MALITTERLILREVTSTDAEFIMALYNEPSFIEGIGDKQVYTVEQAIEYIANTFTKSYHDNGYGMFLVVLREVGTPIGICGLIRRDYRDDFELGYGVSKMFRSKGYAGEAATAVLEYGKQQLNAKEFIAVTSMSNQASIKTLERLGFLFSKVEKLAAYDEESRLFKLAVD